MYLILMSLNFHKFAVLGNLRSLNFRYSLVEGKVEGVTFTVRSLILRNRFLKVTPGAFPVPKAGFCNHYHLFGQWRKPHVATTYSYEDICKKPFRKISERTVNSSQYFDASGLLSSIFDSHYLSYIRVFQING